MISGVTGRTSEINVTRVYITEIAIQMQEKINNCKKYFMKLSGTFSAALHAEMEEPKHYVKRML
jgi:hypothetical protein